MPYPLLQEDAVLVGLYRRQDTVTAPGGTTTAPIPPVEPVSTTTTTTTPIPPTTTSTSSTISTTTSTTTPPTNPITTTASSTTDGGGSGSGGGGGGSVPVSTSTTPGGGGVVVSGSTTIPPPTSATTPTSGSSTSSVARTIIITSNGQIITTVTQVPTMVPSTSGSSHSNVGPIVGGVVGGILGLAAILAVLFWWLRKRKDKAEIEGDIFDPDRNTTRRPGRMGRGDIDLATDPEMLAHPYTLPTGAGTAAAAGAAAGAGLAGREGSGSPPQQRYSQHGPAPGEIFNYGNQPYGESPYPSMRQSGAGPMAGAGAAAILGRGLSTSSSYPQSPGSDGSRPMSMHSDGTTHYTQQQAGSHVPMPSANAGVNFLGVPSGSAGSSSAAAAKRHEASSSSRLHLANQGEMAGSGPVLQHADGGRVPAPAQDETPAHEIPPAYDTIPQDDEPGGSGSGGAVASRPLSGSSDRGGARKP
ncbi:hypothetical protein FRB95_011556 [Tulasnella sp. JGI-2019a]|nr:hypothetical protein FRB95_011556 [Tulasnella sp. JGI-2019a]